MTTIDLVTAIETHDVDALRGALDGGVDVNTPVRGKTLTTWLTEMYSRGPGFAACMRLFLARGATLDDPRLAEVLCNDADALQRALANDPSLLAHRTTMVSAFTPLDGATLLHVAAEYGHRDVVQVLLDAGVDVHAAALVDAHGLNGHTSLFHTLNSAHNHAAPIMRMLLDAGARTDMLLRGITWGRGFEWETTLFDVTPLAYAQCGLLPQMHRNAHDIYENIRALLTAGGRSIPPLDNVPNRYLAS